MRALSLVPVAWLLAVFLARAQVSPTIVTTIPVLRLDARPILHWKGGTGVLAITFADSLRLESTTLRSRGLRDVAIVCLNADGSIRWTNHIGGPADDAAADVHVGTNFITCLLAAGGSTGAPSTLRVNNVTLATNGEYDVGLVGYTLAGRLEWFRVDGGPFPDVPTSMVVDEEQGIAYEDDNLHGDDLKPRSWPTQWARRHAHSFSTPRAVGFKPPHPPRLSRSDLQPHRRRRCGRREKSYIC